MPSFRNLVERSGRVGELYTVLEQEQRRQTLPIISIGRGELRYSPRPHMSALVDEGWPELADLPAAQLKLGAVHHSPGFVWLRDPDASLAIDPSLTDKGSVTKQMEHHLSLQINSIHGSFP